LTTTGEGFTGTASITGTVPQGTFSYTITVTDPDDLSDSLLVEEDGLVAALLNLEFVATSASALPDRTWTDPNDPTFVVDLEQTTATTHGCNRGTYRLVANKHVNGGVVIGRFYVGNSNGSSYGQNASLTDSFGWDGVNGNPFSATGDVGISGFRPPSASAQGNIDSRGNVNNKWNIANRFITTAQPTNQNWRYSYLSITEDDADTIASDFTDPFNSCYVTFTFEPDTYLAGTSQFQTHADAVQFQVIQQGSTAGFNSGAEIFSGKLGTTQGQCTSGAACDPALFAYVSFNVCTGAYLPDYDPLNPT